MPIEPPPVQVVDDPLVVFVFIGLFWTLVIVALVFALLGRRA